MSENYDKGTIYYIVSETGIPDKIFLNSGDARTAFETPNLGAEKVVIEAKVLRKKVQTVVEQEVQ